MRHQICCNISVARCFQLPTPSSVARFMSLPANQTVARASVMVHLVAATLFRNGSPSEQNKIRLYNREKEGTNISIFEI
ncbi:hypothetical protein HNY73_011746 [Argiope bruennichi]|uniref:Uncharacterized protein n=1 Tax=Argiope bruennichi TaxID=94029 RepID=A0A8T0EYB5_ARGBR|nr:hypothetical protein HNY73_011746 [Argiope bruennichi]